jgi:hypothetical protein
MCFYQSDDYDWFATINELSDVILDKPRHCTECGRSMKAGEPAVHLFQQEHEECDCCYGDSGPCDCPKNEDDECIECKCEEPNFGESCEDWQCLECNKFLKAIEQVETDEKCPPNERQPAWGQMVDSIREFEREDAIKYFRKAYKMYPELKASGYLKRMWARMFDLSFA